jgi:hypothetical protein
MISADISLLLQLYWTKILFTFNYYSVILQGWITELNITPYI